MATELADRNVTADPADFEARLARQSQAHSLADFGKWVWRLVASNRNGNKHVFDIIFRIDLDLLTLQILALARGANDQDFGVVGIGGLHFHLAVDAEDEDLGVVNPISKVTAAVADENF